MEIPNRDDDLPHYYVLSSHVNVLPEWGAKRVLLALLDGRCSAMKTLYDKLAQKPFPDGTPKGMALAGQYPISLLAANSSIFVFLRPPYLHRDSC